MKYAYWFILIGQSKACVPLFLWFCVHVITVVLENFDSNHIDAIISHLKYKTWRKLRHHYHQVLFPWLNLSFFRNRTRDSFILHLLFICLFFSIYHERHSVVHEQEPNLSHSWGFIKVFKLIYKISAALLRK